MKSIILISVTFFGHFLGFYAASDVPVTVEQIYPDQNVPLCPGSIVTYRCTTSSAGGGQLIWKYSGNLRGFSTDDVGNIGSTMSLGSFEVVLVSIVEDGSNYTFISNATSANGLTVADSEQVLSCMGAFVSADVTITFADPIISDVSVGSSAIFWTPPPCNANCTVRVGGEDITTLPCSKGFLLSSIPDLSEKSVLIIAVDELSNSKNTSSAAYVTSFPSTSETFGLSKNSTSTSASLCGPVSIEHVYNIEDQAGSVYKIIDEGSNAEIDHNIIGTQLVFSGECSTTYKIFINATLAAVVEPQNCDKSIYGLTCATLIIFVLLLGVLLIVAAGVVIFYFKGKKMKSTHFKPHLAASDHEQHHIPLTCNLPISPGENNPAAGMTEKETGIKGGEAAVEEQTGQSQQKQKDTTRDAPGNGQKDTDNTSQQDTSESIPSGGKPIITRTSEVPKHVQKAYVETAPVEGAQEAAPPSKHDDIGLHTDVSEATKDQAQKPDITEEQKPFQITDKKVYVDHQYPINHCLLSPNAEFIASTDTSGTLRVWKILDSDVILTTAIAKCSESVFSLDWVQHMNGGEESTRLLLGTGNGLKLFNAATAETHWHLLPDKNPSCKVLSVVSCPESNLFAFSYVQNTIKKPILARFVLGHIIDKKLKEYTTEVAICCLAFNHDGSQVVCGHIDGTITLQNVETVADYDINPICDWKAHKARICNVLINTEDKAVYSRAQDGKICKWDISREAARKVASYIVADEKNIVGITSGKLLAFNSDYGNKYILTSSPTEGIMFQVDSEGKLTKIMCLPNNNTPVTCVDWGRVDERNSRCVMGSTDNSVRCITLEFKIPP